MIWRLDKRRKRGFSGLRKIICGNSRQDLVLYIVQVGQLQHLNRKHTCPIHELQSWHPFRSNKNNNSLKNKSSLMHHSIVVESPKLFHHFLVSHFCKQHNPSMFHATRRCCCLIFLYKLTFLPCYQTSLLLLLYV